jgi:tetratricopeptide (TPR) repeat protein
MAARGCGDRHVLAAALVQRARAEVGLGHYDEAASLAEESLRLNDLHGHREGAIGSLHALGLAWAGQGRLDRAHGAFVRALATATAIHHSGATAESLDGLAIVACRQCRWFDAARVLAAADALRASTGIRRSVLVSDFVAEVETVVSTRMEAVELHRARHEGATADPVHLAAEERSRTAH